MSHDAPPDDVPRPIERRGVLRIDATPGGKKFQGVWLELEDGRRYVVDYRARPLWRSFQDRAVRFTGHCYEPFGQAIAATHFEVATLRLASPREVVAPLVALGPEQRLCGCFVAHSYPQGSKLADSPETRFRCDDGRTFVLAGGEARPAGGPRCAVIARVVEPSPTYAAQPGGEQLWIMDVREPDAAAERPDPRRVVRCPEGEP